MTMTDNNGNGAKIDDDSENHEGHGAAEQLVTNDTKLLKEIFCKEKAGECSVAAIKNSLKKRFFRNVALTQNYSKNYCKFRCKD